MDDHKHKIYLLFKFIWFWNLVNFHMVYITFLNVFDHIASYINYNIQTFNQRL